MVLFNPETDQMYTLNPVSAFIWQALESATHVVTIAEAVTQHFEVSLPQAQEDVQEFVDSLKAADLLETDAS